MNSTFKTVFIGETTTGKTSIVMRLARNVFYLKTECTIGASFMKFKNDDINYEFWDTAGQERFHALLPMYFRGAKIVIFVFDVSNIDSIKDFDRYIKIANDLGNYKILIIGNKTDLITNDELKRAEIQIKKKVGNSPIADKVYNYIFTSAKTGENFDILKDTLNNCAKEIEDPSKIDDIVGRMTTISLDDKTKNANETSKCYC